MGGDKLFTLHAVRIFDELERIYRSEKSYDFTIYVGSSEFKAHKLLLEISSDYFKAMFSLKTSEVDNGCVTLSDVKPTGSVRLTDRPTVKAILDFIYSCRIELTENNVEDIILAASKLQVAAVQDACEQFIGDNINVENCIGVLCLADRINLPDLFKKALNFCLGKFTTIVKGTEFTDIDETILMKIISHQELSVDEYLVFQTVIDWIKADQANRLCELDRLMSNVRFVFIDPIQLVELNSIDIVSKSPACCNMIDTAKNYLLVHKHPEIQKKYAAKLNTVPRGRTVAK